MQQERDILKHIMGSSLDSIILNINIVQLIWPRPLILKWEHKASLAFN